MCLVVAGRNPPPCQLPLLPFKVCRSRLGESCGFTILELPSRSIQRLHLQGSRIPQSTCTVSSHWLATPLASLTSIFTRLPGAKPRTAAFKICTYRQAFAVNGSEELLLRRSPLRQGDAVARFYTGAPENRTFLPSRSMLSLLSVQTFFRIGSPCRSAHLSSEQGHDELFAICQLNLDCETPVNRGIDEGEKCTWTAKTFLAK